MFDFNVLRAHATESPQTLAFVDDAYRLNYAEFGSLTYRIAGFLKEQGIKQGMLVNVFLPTYLGWATTYALHLLGATTMSHKFVQKSEPIIIPDWHISLTADAALPMARNILMDQETFDRIKAVPELPNPEGYKSENDVVRLISTSGTSGANKHIAVYERDLKSLAIQKGSWNIAGGGASLSLFPLGCKTNL